MKIDRKNPIHWLRLFLFGCQVALAIVLRKLWRSGRDRHVVLYGHRLTGNLLAIQRQLTQDARPLPKPVFLTMDPAYAKRLRRAGMPVRVASRPSCARLLAECRVVISDHGLHAMQLLLRLSDIRFCDVWHGIPYKGFDAEDFRVLHRYDEIWVASPFMAEMYIRKFGFSEDQIHVTGYARTDRLVRREAPSAALMRHLGVGPGSTRPVVLFAPTWRQDDRNRNIYPFGTTEEDFLGALQELAESTNSLVIVRTHLNAVAPKLSTEHGAGVISLPFSDYPDTEDLLLATDVLVCDWSSIAFDFLLLERPTVFLDVPAPFAKGFSLGPEYRYGKVVTSIDRMDESVRLYLTKPEYYYREHQTQMDQVRKEIFNAFADGYATERCISRLSLTSNFNQ